MRRSRDKGLKPAGFYRTFRPAQMESLQAAIDHTVGLAEQFGLREIEVNRQATGVGTDGNYHVGLRGTTKREGRTK